MNENTRNALSERYKGTKNPKAKLNEDQVKQIRKLAKEGKISLREIGLAFGISKGNVYEIKKRNCCRHILD